MMKGSLASPLHFCSLLSVALLLFSVIGVAADDDNRNVVTTIAASPSVCISNSSLAFSTLSTECPRSSVTNKVVYSAKPSLIHICSNVNGSLWRVDNTNPCGLYYSWSVQSVTPALEGSAYAYPRRSSFLFVPAVASVSVPAVKISVDNTTVDMKAASPVLCTDELLSSSPWPIVAPPAVNYISQLDPNTEGYINVTLASSTPLPAANLPYSLKLLPVNSNFTGVLADPDDVRLTASQPWSLVKVTADSQYQGGQVNINMACQNSSIVTQMFSTVVCEHDEVKLSCPTTYSITVLSALYGRDPKSTPLSCITSPLSYQCGSNSSSLDVVAKMCNGRNKCEVEAENEVFGDPCVGVFKYLRISWKCDGTSQTYSNTASATQIQLSEPEAKVVAVSAFPAIANSTAAPAATSLVCEHYSLNLNCSAGRVLQILTANYGRASGNGQCLIGGQQVTSFNCGNNQTSLAVVQGLCEGKQKCSVAAENSVFSDPCVGTYKYLEVDYRCVPIFNLIKISNTPLVRKVDVRYSLSRMPTSKVVINVNPDRQLSASVNTLVFHPSNWTNLASVSYTVVNTTSTTVGFVQLRASSLDPVFHGGIATNAIDMTSGVSGAAASLISTASVYLPYSWVGYAYPNSITWASFDLVNNGFVSLSKVRVTAYNLPAGVTVSYPSDRPFTSLNSDDSLSIGERDFIAILFSIPATFTDSYFDFRLNCTADVNGTLFISQPSARFVVKALPTKPLTVSTPSVSIEQGVRQWVTFDLKGINSVDNVQLQITDALNFTVEYPGNRASSSLYNDARLDAAESDFIAVALTAPASQQVGSFVLRARVTWTAVQNQVNFTDVTFPVRVVAPSAPLARRLTASTSFEVPSLLYGSFSSGASEGRISFSITNGLASAVSAVSLTLTTLESGVTLNSVVAPPATMSAGSSAFVVYALVSAGGAFARCIEATAGLTYTPAVGAASTSSTPVVLCMDSPQLSLVSSSLTVVSGVEGSYALNIISTSQAAAISGVQANVLPSTPYASLVRFDLAPVNSVAPGASTLLPVVVDTRSLPDSLTSFSVDIRILYRNSNQQLQAFVSSLEVLVKRGDQVGASTLTFAPAVQKSSSQASPASSLVSGGQALAMVLVAAFTVLFVTVM